MNIYHFHVTTIHVTTIDGQPQTLGTYRSRVLLSRGIGAATALVLADHGYRVVVNHRASTPQAEEAVAADAGVVDA
jgi:hypothetical protein